MLNFTRCSVAAVCLFIFSVVAIAQPRPIDLAIHVANKVIQESSFGYFPYIQRKSTFAQTIDLRAKTTKNDQVYYAFSYLISNVEKDILIGISSGSPVKVWVNGEMVYQNQDSTKDSFREVAYGMLEFADTFRIQSARKENTILIKALSGKDSRVILGVIQNDGFRDMDVSFSLEPLLPDNSEDNWLICGPWHVALSAPDPLSTSFPPESGYKPFYVNGLEIKSWHFQEKPLLLGHTFPTNASFRRHPYTEWHYSNGATMWSILRLAEFTGQNSYHDFVKDFCEFTLNDYHLFEYQYHNLNEFNGHNHRIFRMSMLDDSGAPALPFIHLYQQGQLDQAWFLIEKAAQHASLEQVRLDDQTLCRPEPFRYTIWADDLFMYVPFILKYAEITGNEALKDDAIHQAFMFYNYLFDQDKQLYYHGWYSNTATHSVANWSRANGWVAWAMSELLQNIEPGHPRYAELLKIHRQHLEGLLIYQHEGGLWHQVIDRPDTYLETSGSAMFAIAMARGVQSGWLDRKYQTAALKAWDGISKRIDADGTVNGICQGTGIGETIDFYQQRPTPLHDPRGIGAVITAAIEIQKLIDH